jgi:outer membrane protein, heavy metal efflux system
LRFCLPSLIRLARKARPAFWLLLALPAAGAAQQLSLHEAIQEAMRAPAAQAAAAQTDEVRGQVRQAGLGPNPRLFLQSEDWRPWGDAFDFPTQTEDYAFLSQTLEVDGKRHKRVALASARLAQAQAEEQMTRFAIAGRVAMAYWNAAALERTVALLQQDMQAVDEMVRYHKERVDAGAMRGVDLLRMRIERDRLEVTLRSTERDAAQARLELFKQMGRPAPEKVQFADPVEAVVPVEPVPVEAVLARRADLQQAREAVSAAEADVRLQKANGVPDPDLIAGYKRNSANNTGYASLQMPLPFRNRNQGEIERAEASVRYARNSLQALELQVRAEIKQSEENYRREQDIVGDLLPEMRASAKQNLQLMTEAYRIGGVDLLRYLDAERTEFDVEVSAVRTYADYQQAALRLQLSYGVQP